MAKRTIICAHCGNTGLMERGHVTRSLSMGMYVYCSRECSGLGRRKGKTKAEKVAEKAAYDAEYRANNAEMLRVKKAARFKETYDPEAARIARKLNMPRHVEYCRRPAYRQKKKEYDRVHLAEKQYQEFADAALILRDIESEIDNRITRYEIYQQNGTINKTQRRKRAYVNTAIGSSPKVGALGDVAGDQE